MTLKKNNIFALLICTVVIHSDYFCYPFCLTQALSLTFIILYLCEYMCEILLLTAGLWKGSEINP